MDNLSSKETSDSGVQASVLNTNSERLSLAQETAFKEQLEQIHGDLKVATAQLNLLFHSTTQVKDSDLYKQPETNLLNYVQVLTAKTTSKVLDVLQSLPEVLNQSRSSNDAFLKTLCDKSELVFNSDFVATVSNQLEQHNQLIETLSAAHSEILSLQSFQDLSSQALNRAIEITDDVNKSIKHTSDSLGCEHRLKADKVSTQENDPALGAEKNTAQLAQDDVDSILSSFNSDH